MHKPSEFYPQTRGSKPLCKTDFAATVIREDLLWSDINNVLLDNLYRLKYPIFKMLGTRVFWILEYLLIYIMKYGDGSQI